MVYETNKKLYNLLKKKKKGHLFDKRWKNEEYISTFNKTVSEGKGISPTAKSTAKSLRKTSKVVQNWKEVLEIAQIQKHQNKHKKSKFLYLNKINSFICNLFSKKA